MGRHAYERIVRVYHVLWCSRFSIISDAMTLSTHTQISTDDHGPLQEPRLQIQEGKSQKWLSRSRTFSNFGKVRSRDIKVIGPQEPCQINDLRNHTSISHLREHTIEENHIDIALTWTYYPCKSHRYRTYVNIPSRQITSISHLREHTIEANHIVKSISAIYIWLTPFLLCIYDDTVFSV